MQKSLVRKGLVLGIIVLFIGAVVIPNISGDIKKKSESKNRGTILAYPSISADNSGTLHVVYTAVPSGSDFYKPMYMYKEPPVTLLLVHGWQLKGGFDPDGLWKNMSFRLTGDNEGSWVCDMKRYEGNGFIVYTSNYAHDTSMGTHKNIRYYADNLAGEIEVIKSEENASKVIIVAYSMGGLVSRAYIESSDFGGNLYGDDISKLIMLGTPNHGDNWILIFPLLPLIYLYFLLIGWVAEWQMIPYSFFLNTLNHGNPLKIFGEDIINSNVNYYTIAGNISKSLIWGDSDGFVTVKSVQLSNVPHFNYPVNHTELRTDYDVHQKVKELILQ